MPPSSFALAIGRLRGLSLFPRWLSWKRPGVLRTTMLVAVLLMVVCSFSGFAQHTEKAKHHKRHTVKSRMHERRKSKRHRREQLSRSRSTYTRRSTAPRRRTTARERSRSSHRRVRHRLSARSLARLHQMHHAFVASSELRPMAQQLIALRTPQAYAGVLRYARSHTGEASAAAYMALGQAYFDDGKYPHAVASFDEANRAGQALDDYADYLAARANFAQQQYAAAQQTLQNFAERHPDSILIDRATLLRAQISLNEGDPQSALVQLSKLRGPLATSPEYFFVLGKASQLAGNRSAAQQMYTRIYVDYPVSAEAGQVKNQLQQMGLAAPFTVAERLRHADGLYLDGRYGAAQWAYQTLAEDPAVVGTAQENELRARAAVASFKQTHHVDPSELAQLSDSNDDAGATRLYLMLEAARDRKDTDQVKALVNQLEQRFPTSRWTAEALFSAGNMALVTNDLPAAITYYSELATRFPDSTMAPLCHWHAAWLTYRAGHKKVAAELFDQQIERYPNDGHLSAALYWRGVVYQEVENNPAAAAAYYKKLVDTFPHYYYAGVAAQRLAALGAVAPAPLPQLSSLQDPAVPDLTVDIPDDDIHVERARLLANAGLNEYIVPEMSASPDSAPWRAYAEAELYSSYGENWRALHILKRKVHAYFAAPIDAIPRGYWDLLFPQPYWPVLERTSREQGLDPYLVASLIRQESEFNPGAVSYANAWGLMQLLPRVGRELAHKEHVRPFRTAYLLNPEVNLKLGTAYFRQLMDEFHGQPEYALAAYNAGDDRVQAWLSNGPYASLPEFVESIPFTQTREYVEGILRNREIYQQLYGANGDADSRSARLAPESVSPTHGLR